MPDNTTLIISFAMLSAAMLVAWLVVMRTANGGWTDVVWTLVVGLSAVYGSLASAGAGWRAIFAAVLIGAWSLRLAVHLAARVTRAEEDFRYQRLRKDWGSSYPLMMLGFLQFQALCAAPLVLAVATAAARPGPFPDLADVLGGSVLLIAVAGEAVSDWQLAAFSVSTASRGKILDRGLWGWSRHPNFFFEWLGWCTWPIVAIGPQLAVWPGALALLAPVTLYVLLVHVTGIPPIEERMLRSRGDSYRAYQRRVPRFFPWPPGMTAANTGKPLSGP